jgi:uncharacterized membrane protein YbaN (DUF454 family)
MIGILLTVLAVLFVLALAFCFSDQSNPFKELYFLRKDQKQRAEEPGVESENGIPSIPKPR